MGWKRFIVVTVLGWLSLFLLVGAVHTIIGDTSSALTLVMLAAIGFLEAWKISASGSKSESSANCPKVTVKS